MRICNLAPSHACNTIKISLKELRFGSIDRYTQKGPLRLYSEYSTTVEFHLLLKYVTF